MPKNSPGRRRYDAGPSVVGSSRVAWLGQELAAGYRTLSAAPSAQADGGKSAHHENDRGRFGNCGEFVTGCRNIQETIFCEGLCHGQDPASLDIDNLVRKSQLADTNLPVITKGASRTKGLNGGGGSINPLVNSEKPPQLGSGVPGSALVSKVQETSPTRMDPLPLPKKTKGTSGGGSNHRTPLARVQRRPTRASSRWCASRRSTSRRWRSSPT